MIEKIKKLLFKKYNYELVEYKICHEDIKKIKFLIPSLILFLIVAVLYFTIEPFSFVVLFFAFFIFVLIPMALRNGSNYDVIIVTPEYLIQQTTKNRVVAIAFDNIDKFRTEKSVVVIGENKNSISLAPNFLSSDILRIIDILEAKGKTFDKTKEYMIRPIKIIIEDDDIKIRDVRFDETSTEKLTSENIDDYEMLTPGFLDGIILMNSVVDSAHNKDNNLYLNINSFEVNTNHPENITFESQIAHDCIIIFEDAEILSIIKKQARGKNERIIEPSLNNLCVELENGVISDWKYNKNSIDVQFSVGLYIVRTSFNYKEVLLGWNGFNSSKIVVNIEPTNKVVLQTKEEEHIPTASEEFAVKQIKILEESDAVPTIEPDTGSVEVLNQEPEEEPAVFITPVHEVKPIIEKVSNEKVAKKTGVADTVSAYLSKMKVADLRLLAKAKKIPGYSKLNKTQLVNALK